MEPTDFDPKWYSHKFRGPGLRYEVGLCIRTGHIVWAHGGLPCGEWPDLKLARDVFIYRLLPGEKALADKGYRDDNFFENPNGDPHKKIILARHETVNARIKQFRCMRSTFRYALYLHPCFYHAVDAVVTFTAAPSLEGLGSVSTLQVFTCFASFFNIFTFSCKLHCIDFMQVYCKFS